MLVKRRHLAAAGAACAIALILTACSSGSSSPGKNSGGKPLTKIIEDQSLELAFLERLPAASLRTSWRSEDRLLRRFASARARLRCS